MIVEARSAFVTDALEYARTLSDPYFFNHGARSWLFAEKILRAFPRLKMKERFAEACCRLVAAKPQTSSDNFLRDFGERFVPGYRPASAVDFLMKAPVDE